MFDVDPYAHGCSVDPVLLRQADSRTCAGVMPGRRGTPRSNREWTALVRIASGEHGVCPAQCARLIALGLVERKAGRSLLTHHGRLTLGLPA